MVDSGSRLSGTTMLTLMITQMVWLSWRREAKRCQIKSRVKSERLTKLMVTKTIWLAHLVIIISKINIIIMVKAISTGIKARQKRWKDKESVKANQKTFHRIKELQTVAASNPPMRRENHSWYLKVKHSPYFRRRRGQRINPVGGIRTALISILILTSSNWCFKISNHLVLISITLMLRWLHKSVIVSESEFRALRRRGSSIWATNFNKHQCRLLKTMT